MKDILSIALERFIDLKCNIRFTRNHSAVADNYRSATDGEITTFTADVDSYEHFNVTALSDENSVMFSIDCKNKANEYRSFVSEKSVSFGFADGEKPDAIRYYYHRYTCCLEPEICHSLSELGNRTHTALVRMGDEHYSLLCLTGDIFRCDMDGTGYHISVNDCGHQSIKGTFLVISRGDDPFEAISRSHEFARAHGGIPVPLKRERVLPEVYRGLGYCTFNTYDLDITEEKVFAKLDEYKAAGVPLNWVLIDDGWMTYEGKYLLGMMPDPVKFPNGMKYLVQRIKNEYNVKHVGVWLTINAYWCGIGEGSEAFLQMRDTLMQTKSGHWYPSLDVEKGEAFWDYWLGYLGDCGVDFIKIDSQSQYPNHIEGEMPTLNACRITHGIIERMAEKHLTNGVLNCMGMDIENVHSRPISAVSRNSHDFWVEEGYPYECVREFVEVNTLGAIWHDNMMYCDYDMWWSSDDVTGVHNGVLRAIHDGPNYLSDPGPCNLALVAPAVGDNGEHELCDHGAYPTLDCIYDRNAEFKVWNRAGENFALAVYNFTGEALSSPISLTVIPGMDEGCDYVAYEYFTRSYSRVGRCGSLMPATDVNGVSVYSIYPIKRDDGGEYIMLGDTSKYVSAKTERKTKTYLADISV